MINPALPEIAVTTPASYTTPRGTIPQHARTLVANIGLAHAYCSPAPTAALDIDDIPKAMIWLEERGADLQALLDAPDAVQIVSGKQGRAKLLYRLLAGAVAVPTKQIGDSETGEMILEFRCATANGRTAQDLIPPSVHPETGSQYAWAGSGDWRNLPTMPGPLVAIWLQQTKQAKASRRPSQRGAGHDCKAVDDSPRRRATVAAMLEHISADCSYDVYRSVVWAILSLGWHDSEALAKAWCQSAEHRYDPSSFVSIIASHDETRSPSIGTIHHLASEGGWHE